jgi:hypothetical protein
LQRANLVTARAVGLAQRTYLKDWRDLLADQWRLTNIQEVMAIPAVFMIFANGCVLDIKFAKNLMPLEKDINSTPGKNNQLARLINYR